MTASPGGTDPRNAVPVSPLYGIPDEPASGDAQRLYIDKLTGKHLNRQGWTKLRPRMRAGDVLVLPGLDRLGRSQTEMLQLFAELTDMGVHINVIGGPIPFATRKAGPATEMAKALLLFLGQVELIDKTSAAGGSGLTNTPVCDDRSHSTTPYADGR